VIVDPSVREQSGVDSVIRMMVAEDHVGDVFLTRPLRGKRGEQRAAVGDHPWIDDDHRLTVNDQRYRPANALVVTLEPDIPLVQHVHLS
jgi:hypothetical protein